MADEQVVSNSYISSNPDYPVRITQATSDNAQIQHIRLDFGEAGNEVTVSALNPLPVNATFSGSIGNVTVDNGAGAAAVNIQDGGNTITVDGIVTANLGTLNGAATSAKQDSQTALLTTIDADTSALAGCVSGTEVQVDVLTLPAITGSVTVSGSVTANAGTNLNTSALALEATLSTLNGKVTTCNTGAIAGTVTANAGTNLNTSALALETTLSSLNGKVTACNTGAVTISTALPAGNNNIGDVDIASMPAITGTVTANAGTNLNTSALALEAGNLASILTSVQLIDDAIATHDSAAPTKIMQGGGKAYTASALPGVVTADDAVISTHDLQGRQVIAPFTAVPLDVNLDLTSSGENTIIAAPGNGLSIYVTSITCTASGGAALFAFRKGTGGTIFVRTGVSGVTSMGHASFPTPYKVGNNTLVSVAPSVSTATQTSMTYFIAAS